MKNQLSTLLVGMAFSASLSAQIDAGATQTVKNLYGNLKEVCWDTKSIMFGQEFFNSYKWSGNGSTHEDETLSDFKSVTGVHPAVLGQDFHYYLYKDATEKRRHKEAAIYAYNQGCVITFDFHMKGKWGNSENFTTADKNLMYNIGNNIDTWGEVTWFQTELDKVIAVINNDLKIPIVFRLFHEMNIGQFWWGTQASGGSSAYIKMYQKAVDYIKARTNYVIFAWSPNYPFNTSYYPNNNYVDVIGLDMYDIGASGPSFSTMVSQVTTLSDYAWNNGKVAVYSELGNRDYSPEQWQYWWYNINENLQASNRAWKIAWMLTWINTSWGNNNHIPYVAHSASTQATKDALIAFKNMTTIINQPGAASRNMYNTSYLKSAKEETAVASISSNQTSVYPNPVTAGYFNVDLAKLQGSATNVIVADIQGRQLYSCQTITETSQLQVSVSNFVKGVYFVKVTSDGRSETHKIVIQ